MLISRFNRIISQDELAQTLLRVLQVTKQAKEFLADVIIAEVNSLGMKISFIVLHEVQQHVHDINNFCCFALLDKERNLWLFVVFESMRNFQCDLLQDE